MAVSAAVVMFPGSDAGVVTIVALMIVAAVFDIVMVVASEIGRASCRDRVSSPV